jgi:class 3 adenylate cyclase
MNPATRYARSGEASLAYQVVGEGEIDLLLMPGWIFTVDHIWEATPLRRFLERFAEFCRLIVYDRRGSGLSDAVGVEHTLEQEVEDALAVLDAAGSERTAVYARGLGGPGAVRLAAEQPERVSALVLYAAVARSSWAPDYDWALKLEERAELAEQTLAERGQDRSEQLRRQAPSVADDPALNAWWLRHERLAASPAVARAAWRAANDLDVRALLPGLQLPTLVLHRPAEKVFDVRHSLYLAEHVPGARYVELPGIDSLEFIGETDPLLEEVREFLTGVRAGGEPSRALLTVMFTDIVDSTARAAQLGDRGWGDLLAQHDDVVRREIVRFGGHEVKTTGDGFLVTFEGPPSSALRCAQAISAAAAELGTEVRIGLHTGECEVSDGDIAGMAVHVAARVMAEAGPSEVLVSPAVSGAVVGGPFSFEDRGAHELKGVPGSWPLFALR